MQSAIKTLRSDVGKNSLGVGNVEDTGSEKFVFCLVHNDSPAIGGNDPSHAEFEDIICTSELLWGTRKKKTHYQN